ncbi:MAG TPA: hypothetical protein VIM75_17925 [Ohtaekwangia sp.]|uniref:hypothetical protein n=1 Tax=Ohtaekwangia sp. TaxID=2066019 RepID=UPI002F95AA85
MASETETDELFAWLYEDMKNWEHLLQACVVDRAAYKLKITEALPVSTQDVIVSR